MDHPSNPAKVLHLLETGGPGGAERVLLQLACHIAPRYQSVVGLVRAGWLQSQLVGTGIPHVMLNGGKLGDVGVLRRLLQTVHEHGIGLIHAHEFYMAMVGSALSCYTRIPLIVTMHGKNYYPARRRRRLLCRLFAAQAAALVAVSEDLKQFFAATNGIQPDQLQVIYNGTDVERLGTLKRSGDLLASVGIPSDAKVVGTLGNLYPVKGHLYLVRAAERVVRCHRNAHVVILGRGSEHDRLIHEARQLGIEDRIHLLGYREDAAQWMACFDVFTLPSLSEGTPLSLLEAMASGLPSVVSSVGGIPEIIRDGETGFLIPPEDSEGLADKIIVLLSDRAAASAIGARAKCDAIARFSIRRMVQDYTDLYTQTLSQSSGSKTAA